MLHPYSTLLHQADKPGGEARLAFRVRFPKPLRIAIFEEEPEFCQMVMLSSTLIAGAQSGHTGVRGRGYERDIT